MRKLGSILLFTGIALLSKSQNADVTNIIKSEYSGPVTDSVKLQHKLLLGTWQDVNDSLHTLIIRQDTMLDIKEPKNSTGTAEERIIESAYILHTLNRIIILTADAHGIEQAQLNIYSLDATYLSINRNGTDINTTENYQRFISPIH